MDILGLIFSNIAWIVFLIVYVFAASKNFQWTKSIRSLTTFVIIMVFCDLSLDGKIEPKDVLLTVSMIMNFYFLVKQRNGQDLESKK